MMSLPGSCKASLNLSRRPSAKVCRFDARPTDEVPGDEEVEEAGKLAANFIGKIVESDANNSGGVAFFLWRMLTLHLRGQGWKYDEWARNWPGNMGKTRTEPILSGVDTDRPGRARLG
jgi:hypothetical protein